VEFPYAVAPNGQLFKSEGGKLMKLMESIIQKTEGRYLEQQITTS
jgi:hypothetical protein